MPDIFNIKGESAIITGAGKGLGENFAHVLAQAGANLLLVSRGQENIARVSREINEKYGVSCDYCAADIGIEKDVNAVVEKCVKQYGKIDILVNNAASMRNNIPQVDTTLEQFQAVMHPNVTGTFLFSKAAAMEMKKAKKGRIVNIASISALVVNKGVHGGSYEISKAAVVMLTKTMAVELCRYGISVNAICPGYYGTDPNKEFFAKDPAFYNNVIDMIPMGRLGELDELRGVLLLLCSPAASYMQGAVIPVDGGYTIW